MYSIANAKDCLAIRERQRLRNAGNEHLVASSEQPNTGCNHLSLKKRVELRCGQLWTALGRGEWAMTA